MLPPEPGPQKADIHYRRAGEYQELAQRLLADSSNSNGETDIQADAAGALLYEAAKQSVNAVANLRGQDPQENQAKLAELRNIAQDYPEVPNLTRGAREAWNLHIHADQAGLAPAELTAQFSGATAFVNAMRRIYLAVLGTPL